MLEAGRVIPKNLDWLVVEEGVIVSAHRVKCTARIEADTRSGFAILLQQDPSAMLHMGQRVRNNQGFALPA
jgi:hypothetical protein